MGISENLAQQRPVICNRLVLWVIAGLTLLLCGAIAIDLTPWLRGPSGQGEWRWPYKPEGLILWRLLPVFVIAGLLGGWYWLARRSQQVSAWLIAALVPLGVALELSVLATGPQGLPIVARVLNPSYYGYYPPATEYRDLGKFIDTYAENQPNFGHIHLETHPPGNVIFMGLILKAVETVPVVTKLATPFIEPRLASLPDWIQQYDMTEITGGIAASLTIPALGTLTVIPLFLLARRAYGEETARRTAVLYLLAPSLTAFTPKMNIVHTLVTGVAFLLAYEGVQRHRLGLIYLSGLVCSWGNFMYYAMLLLGIVVGFFVLVTGLENWRNNRWGIVRRLAARLGILLLGGITVQLLMTIFFGWDQIASSRAMLSGNTPYNAVRNYWYSLFYTPYDMLLFAGIPVSLLFVTRVIRLARMGLRKESPPVADWLLIGILAVMGLLVISGLQRAENARVFLYLMPAVVFFGAAESERIGMGTAAFGSLASLTFVQLMVFQAVLLVYV